MLVGSLHCQMQVKFEVAGYQLPLDSRQQALDKRQALLAPASCQLLPHFSKLLVPSFCCRLPAVRCYLIVACFKWPVAVGQFLVSSFKWPGVIGQFLVYSFKQPGVIGQFLVYSFKWPGFPNCYFLVASCPLSVVICQLQVELELILRELGGREEGAACGVEGGAREGDTATFTSRARIPTGYLLLLRLANCHDHRDQWSCKIFRAWGNFKTEHTVFCHKFNLRSIFCSFFGKSSGKCRALVFLR